MQSRDLTLKKIIKSKTQKNIAQNNYFQLLLLFFFSWNCYMKYSHSKSWQRNSLCAILKLIIMDFWVLTKDVQCISQYVNIRMQHDFVNLLNFGGGKINKLLHFF